MKQRVVIIGQGYTGRLSLVRSVAKMDCDITIIVLIPKRQFDDNKKKEKPIDAYSKYVSRYLFSENYNTGMLIDILMNQCVTPDHKTFIFPDNDFSAAAVDKHRDVLKEYFFIPHINERCGAVEEWMAKTKQKALASQIGLNVVNSKMIRVKNLSYQILEDIHYPCFVKPLVSIVGGKSGLKRCDNKNDLRNHIDEFIANRNFRDVDLLVEDYKIISREFATLGFSDGKEVIIPGLLELLRIGHGNHFGVAVQGRAFPVTGYEELVNKFKRIVMEIGFIGVFDIDFFESEGKMYFCELNLRFGGSGYAFTKLGVNLPVMMIKSFLGKSIEGMKKTIDREATYFNERMAIDDWYSGYLPTKDFMKMREESEIKFVADEKDPIPQRKLEKEFRLKRIKKTIKGWMGKE